MLSDADARRLHEAALGCWATAADEAQAATAAAPATFNLAGRVPERDVPLGGAGLLLATGGPAPRVRPLGGGDPLPATTADLAGLVRLADALPEVAVVAGPPVRAAGETALGELALCLGCDVQARAAHDAPYGRGGRGGRAHGRWPSPAPRRRCASARR